MTRRADLDPTTVLVVGGGGREHALAWALARSPAVSRVFVAPGNGGTAREPKCENVAIPDDAVADLAAFAADRRVGLTVVGPEKPLPLGIVDRFREAGLPVFGPTAAAARIETSKAWARDFMRRHGIPHPAFRTVDDPDGAAAAIDALGGRVVVKADGLTAGKGVSVCDDADAARAAVRAMMVEGRFGASGARVLVETRAEGPELSVMAVSDGERCVLLPPAQDHKRLLDGDRGPNTGGMGTYAPAPIATADVVARVRSEIVEPALAGMRAEGHPFTGCLYAGLMLTDAGPVVIEFNARFGDPETQVQLPLVASDLAALLGAAAAGDLADAELGVRPDRSAVCVVLAARGYPESSERDVAIHGIDRRRDAAGIHVFHAGTRLAGSGADPGAVVTTGGRALGVVCVRPALAEAVACVYAAIGAGGTGPAAPGGPVGFDGMVFRRDIAARALGRTSAAPIPSAGDA